MYKDQKIKNFNQKRTEIVNSRTLEKVVALLVTLVSMSAVGPAAAADEIEDFYSDNEIRVIIGYGPGGGYDAYSRLLSRFMSKHIPGNPLMVPENMPGGGSRMAASFVHSAAPADGTVIAAFAPQVSVGYLVGEVPFDGRELIWIGSVTNRVNVCVFSKNSPIKSWGDMLETDHILGGEGQGADVDTVSSMLINLFDTKSRLITGYPGTAEMMLAMERSEIDGICGMSWGSVQSRYGDLLESAEIKVVVQVALQPGEGLAAPNVVDMVESEEQNRILNFILAASTVGRPYATAPGTPPARVNALRRAFSATLKDPNFLVEAEKMRLEINPSTGEFLEKILADIYQTPIEIVERATEIINGG